MQSAVSGDRFFSARRELTKVLVEGVKQREGTNALLYIYLAGEVKQVWVKL